jgi:transposase InsO family protein
MTALSSADPGRPMDWAVPKRAHAARKSPAVYSLPPSLLNRTRFNSDCGSEYTANLFRAACDRLRIRQSMGRPGSALDNAVIEAWHSTLTLPAALPGKLRHQGGRPGPGSDLDR